MAGSMPGGMDWSLFSTQLCLAALSNHRAGAKSHVHPWLLVLSLGSSGLAPPVQHLPPFPMPWRDLVGRDWVMLVTEKASGGQVYQDAKPGHVLIAASYGH